jgi:hypothetical protein
MSTNTYFLLKTDRPQKQLSLWSWLLHKRLPVVQPEGSLQLPQQPSTCTYPEPKQPSPYHAIVISTRSILILTTHLHLSLPSGLFPSGFPTNILYAFIFSPIRATWPAHLILCDMIVLIILGEEYKSRSSSLCSFLHSLVPLRSKYPPQHPVLKHPQSMFLP